MAEIVAPVFKNGSKVSIIIISIKVLLNGFAGSLSRSVNKEVAKHGSVIWETLPNKLVE